MDAHQKEKSENKAGGAGVDRDVAVGALKWNELKRDPIKDIVFSWEEVLNMQGNSGPYLQYTFARTQSLLTKAPKSFKSQFPTNPTHEELLLLRTLIHFPETVSTAAQNYSPNLLCNYLYDLAQKFNNFYEKEKIIGGEKEAFLLELTSAVGQVLQNGLKLLGIEAPEKM